MANLPASNLILFFLFIIYELNVAVLFLMMIPFHNNNECYNFLHYERGEIAL